MRAQPLDSTTLTCRLKDRQVSHVVANSAQKLTVHFSDETELIVEGCPEGLLARVVVAKPVVQDTSQRPTKRQLDYLTFIARYMDRFGIAPAESDIQRHFFVSAPSAHQMVVTLERRGFITRQPGVPRSIRLCIALSA